MKSFKEGWKTASKVGGKAFTVGFAVEVANDVRKGNYADAAQNAAMLAPTKVAKTIGKAATASRAATGVGALLYSAPLGNPEADRAMGATLKQRVEASKRSGRGYKPTKGYPNG
jgi:hypothetical protein